MEIKEKIYKGKVINHKGVISASIEMRIETRMGDDWAYKPYEITTPEKVSLGEEKEFVLRYGKAVLNELTDKN